MSDSTDPRHAERSVARSARTSPDAVAERTFSLVKRGYAESEVRAYLRLVADDLATAQERERDLTSRTRELESQLQRPALPLSDQELIAALGEETARVLTQARESASELRAKAEEHARRVVREAQETARELRTTTQHAVEAKTREAEDAARARAKDIVTEARTLRDRVLGDLDERKQHLEHEIGELRAGRGALVETYQLVERALAHATRVLAEEPSVAPEMAPMPPIEDAAAGGAAADGSPPSPAPEGGDTGTAAPPPSEPAPEPPAGEATPAPSEHAPDVGALFEKLRSERAEDDAPAAPAPEVPAADAPTADAPSPSAEPAPGVMDPADVAAEMGARDGGDAAAPAPETAGEDESAQEPTAVAARDAALAEAGEDLVRRGKRALQDEQNDVLDGLRRQRGKIDLGKVLPSQDEQISRWAHVLQPAVDTAYSAGATAGGGARGAAPRALLTELATYSVAPLRDRLSVALEAVDTRSPADAEIVVAQRLGARYREWRGQELETVLGDSLAMAYARGVYDAAPGGARLRWVAAREGKCPDCDDNALEPTVKGSDFPTGQLHPPAHPGCRCVLVVDTDA